MSSPKPAETVVAFHAGSLLAACGSQEAAYDGDDAARSLLSLAGDSALVCFEADRLAALLSRPEVLPLARSALGRLRDLQALALIWLPTEPDHSLAALAGPGDDEGAAPPDALAQTVRVWERVQEAVAAAPPELLAVLGPLLAQDPTFAWLPWPAGAGETMGLVQVGKLLPPRPPQRKRDGSRETLSGDLRELSADLLSPGGAVEDAHPAYEHRSGQVEMAREVADALAEERFLLVEAGTGVGKSLAYLIPAILWATRNGEPVVVSTNTKNLQTQLMESDLPLLRRALGVPFEAALLKGRGNYTCVRRLLSAAVDAANSLLREERLAAAYLLSWLCHAPTGDLEDLPPQALEMLGGLGRLVGRVRAHGDACAGRACSHNDRCPVELARATARRADIIVSNHALTFADAKTTVFPRYSRLIFDEAHNVESAATEGLAQECSNVAFGQLSRQLTGEPFSLLEGLERRLSVMTPGPDVAAAREALAAVPGALEPLLSALGVFGDTLHDFCYLAATDRRAEEGRTALRLNSRVREMPEWQEVALLGAQACSAGAEMLGALGDCVAQLAEVTKAAQPGAEGLDADAYAVKTQWEEALGALASVLQAEGDSSEYVTWAETWRSSRGPAWSLRAAPVDIGPVLAEALLDHKAAVVFTSATLTVDGEFRYFRQRLGLDEYREKLVELAAPSPFDLTEQLLLCVPADMPDPAEGGFNEAVIDALRRICEVTEGGTLALFTARSRMQQAYQRLEPDLRALDLTPLCQGLSGPRWALLERLRRDDRAVLFGLKSFWEGVDVPGDALRCVVICKLPFAVPTDPIIEARQEDAARRGLNPMQDYYIPEAVIGFKQGFGRLIRATTDTGVVFVLDRRVLTKLYGRRFFRSIQRCELSRAPLDECLDQARGWLGR